MVTKAKGPVFVYSNFVSSCGINTFASMLRNEFKFQEVTQDMCPTAKGKHPRFAVFRTGQPEENTRILQIFNSPANRQGDLIKAILGSPAMKEGVTLLRTREVHMLDPYWNRSRIEQIMGRGVRFCSHKDLPVRERRVDVYHYYAVDPKSPAAIYESRNRHASNNYEKTVDLHIRGMGMVKEQTNRLYENILKQIAMDCSLFKHANEPPIISCKTYLNKNNEFSNKNDASSNKNNASSNENNASSNKNKIPRNVSVQTNPIHQPIINSKPKVKIIKKRLQFKNKKHGISSTTSKKTLHKGCPKVRRVDPETKECPVAYPYKRPNKYNTICCYKSKSVKNPLAKCVSLRKDVLKTMAKPYGYSKGPITKKRLCELMMM
jgi:hypothetical protein